MIICDITYIVTRFLNLHLVFLKPREHGGLVSHVRRDVASARSIIVNAVAPVVSHVERVGTGSVVGVVLVHV
jgi:hypothetical protein